MAYLYRKIRSPFWYIQYLDSKRKKHDKSTVSEQTIMAFLGDKIGRRRK
jgi:hypothetical protein